MMGEKPGRHPLPPARYCETAAPGMCAKEKTGGAE